MVGLGFEAVQSRLFISLLSRTFGAGIRIEFAGYYPVYTNTTEGPTLPNQLIAMKGGRTASAVDFQGHVFEKGSFFVVRLDCHYLRAMTFLPWT